MARLSDLRAGAKENRRGDDRSTAERNRSARFAYGPPVEAARTSWGATGVLFAAVGLVIASGFFRPPEVAADAHGEAPAASAVLLTVAPRSDPAEAGRRALRDRLSRNPRDEEAATALAERCIVQARKTRDPRWLGQAQAALGPFWSDPDPSAEVLLLRATIRQSLHAFPEALTDLDRATRLRADPQIELTRATVLAILGRFDEARAACTRVSERLPVVGAGCTAQIEAVTGSARPAVGRLDAVLAGAATEEIPWLLSLRAEANLRLGNRAAARDDLLRALERDPQDAYSRILLQDTHIDEANEQSLAAAIALTVGHENDDAVMLRGAIAAKRAHHPQAAVFAREIQEKQQAARDRGDTVHRREEALFALHIDGDATKALPLAEANFAVQKEPADVRLLLEAAIAAHEPLRGKPAADFARKSKLEDPVIAALLPQVPQ